MDVFKKKNVLLYCSQRNPVAPCHGHSIPSRMGEELRMQQAETTCICQTGRLSQQPCIGMVLLEERTEVGSLKEAPGAPETRQH